METIKDFKSLNLLPSILSKLDDQNYKEPTPIQAQSIPFLLKGRDLLGIAKTGSGKTAAFSLPILDKFGRQPKVMKKNQVRSLILSPTRELATQIEKNISTYGEGLELKSKVVYGGVGKQPQVDALKLGLDVLVATPGRLLDLIENGYTDFSEMEIFVLDEADMMLDMGFLNDVKKVISFLPENLQTLLFSATMPTAIEALANELLEEPVKVEVDAESTVVETIEQKFYALEKKNKGFLLTNLLGNPELSSVLLFCKTKFGADRIILALEEMNVTCAAIHSSKSQKVREESLDAFREDKIRVLVATDVAARGIDIKNVSHVINYNIPEEIKNYIHRIGRTGRAGKSGVAISFCVPSEVELLSKISALTKQDIVFVEDQPFHHPFSLHFVPTVKDKDSKKNKNKKSSTHSRQRRRR